jgi:hypothetical protein
MLHPSHVNAFDDGLHGLWSYQGHKRNLFIDLLVDSLVCGLIHPCLLQVSHVISFMDIRAQCPSSTANVIAFMCCFLPPSFPSCLPSCLPFSLALCRSRWQAIGICHIRHNVVELLKDHLGELVRMELCSAESECVGIYNVFDTCMYI